MKLIPFRRAGFDQQLADDLYAAMQVMPEPGPKPEGSMLARNIDLIERAIDSMKVNATTLDAEIAERQTKLNECRLSIAAFELAHGKMVEGRANG